MAKFGSGIRVRKQMGSTRIACQQLNIYNSDQHGFRSPGKLECRVQIFPAFPTQKSRHIKVKILARKGDLDWGEGEG